MMSHQNVLLLIDIGVLSVLYNRTSIFLQELYQGDVEQIDSHPKSTTALLLTTQSPCIAKYCTLQICNSLLQKKLHLLQVIYNFLLCSGQKIQMLCLKAKKIRTQPKNTTPERFLKFFWRKFGSSTYCMQDYTYNPISN